jgi:cholesterol transport system auxiliary component
VRLRPQLGGLLLCLLASGCGGLLHSTARPEQTYYLRAPAAAAAPAAVAHAAGTDAQSADASAAQSGPMSLRVAHPNAAPGLESPHIMLLQSDYRMDFFTGVRWPASTPEVIESLVVQTLRASGDWSSVADPGSPFPSDFLLQIGVRRFEADYSGGGGGGGAAPVVHVVFDCILGRREGRDVIATFVASGEANAAANRVGAVVGAFEQATDAALNSLAQQAAQAAHAAQQHAPQNGENPVPSMKR